MTNWKKSNYWLCLSFCFLYTLVTLISSSFSSSVFTLLNWNGMWELTNYKMRSHAHVRFPHNWCFTFYNRLIILDYYFGTKKKIQVLSFDFTLFSLIIKFWQIWNQMLFEVSIAKTPNTAQKIKILALKRFNDYWIL